MKQTEKKLKNRTNKKQNKNTHTHAKTHSDAEGEPNTPLYFLCVSLKLLAPIFLKLDISKIQLVPNAKYQISAWMFVSAWKSHICLNYFTFVFILKSTIH